MALNVACDVVVVVVVVKAKVVMSNPYDDV
jgi:hypothetical protein